ncbi:MAG: tRNA pseudouridine(38-40) synthase TruA [Bacillota bacterium]
MDGRPSVWSSPSSHSGATTPTTVGAAATKGLVRRRLKAVVQYDGTDFAGFQRQPGERTVQSVLEEALQQLLGHPVTVKASGRTDAGVHARGQVISFTTSSTMPAVRLPRAIRAFLPTDVLLGPAEDVAGDFDPQSDAASKTYCYRLWRLPEQDIFWTRYTHWHPWHVDFDLLAAEAAAIVGKHDFLSFRAEGSSATTTVREVIRAEWVRREVDGHPDALWEFWVAADGFLYKMVRLLVGTLLDIGRGHLPSGTVKTALLNPGECRIGTCAPGKGLCLEAVSYTLEASVEHRGGIRPNAYCPDRHQSDGPLSEQSLG